MKVQLTSLHNWLTVTGKVKEQGIAAPTEMGMFTILYSLDRLPTFFMSMSSPCIAGAEQKKFNPHNPF